MSHRYVAEIVDGPSTYYGFSYIDTEDDLAYFLFDHLKVKVEPDMEFHYDDDPYKIVMCKVPREQREAFLQAIDLLPGLMAYVGETDYEEYCREFFLKAHLYLRDRKNTGDITRLQ